MRALLSCPIVLSLILLAAHFLREGNTIGVAVPLVLIGLLFVRQAWVPWIVQFVLVLGAIEWAWTLYALAQVRAAHGQPFTRMAIILGIVTLVTLLSALLFRTRTLKSIYGGPNRA